jgi:pimeloyl-ACP methyl ester carboxylesterase
MDTTMSTAVLKAESADGTLIAYERRGSGPALVLVGGALCTAAADAPLAELLAPHFSVFTYDRRGRGASGDTAPYAVRREIEDLRGGDGPPARPPPHLDGPDARSGPARTGADAGPVLRRVTARP